MRVRDRAPAVPGMLLAIRFRGPGQAARSSRVVPRCGQRASGPDDQRELDAPASRNQLQSGGVGGTNGRSSARDRTVDGKMPGNALVRRAIDRRFLFSFSSCHLDMLQNPRAPAFVPPNP